MDRERRRSSDEPVDAAVSGPALVVPDAVRDAILERARAGRPHEVCGVLGGPFDPDGRNRVRSQYPAENVADRPRTRYRIDPEEQFQIFEQLEERGEEIVGFYHSHPRGPAEPSETDVTEATWPERSYLIVSLEPLEIGSWRWRPADAGNDASSEPRGRFERERLLLE
ncbi:desampylase [Natrialba swarupiae]|uniref:M67 family metallopeptidase n=1 Tax=Natrialba swarupiae TaxID=2448032 RepID=A0A5D5ALM2_9EURY|nr:desampylase [Natrialba swarupiae]TYT62014.1 M67 family metallopeptidase [Natrialba swarupiae]